jgi:hypothetical protein
MDSAWNLHDCRLLIVGGFTLTNVRAAPLYASFHRWGYKTRGVIQACCCNCCKMFVLQDM